MIAVVRKKRPLLPRNERLCKVCKVVEDEEHFLINCHIYDDDRNLNFKKIETENPGFLNIKDCKNKFLFLMTQENKIITNILASSINRWFEVRSDIMESYTNFGPNIQLFYLY